MAEVAKIEKFTPGELANLRVELMKSKMDAWQAADLVSKFLAGRGYGVDSDAMRSALPQICVLRSTPAVMQSMLEAVAYVM